MIRVLIVDDHAVVRRGIRQILADAGDIRVVDEAATEQEAIDKTRAGGCDLVLLDLSLPGRGGLEVLKELHEEFPRLPVLVLTMHPEEQYAVRTIRAGAAGYLTKQSAPEELVRAVRQVVAGKRYLTATVAERLAEELEHKDERAPHERLSDREHQIFLMIASGKTVSEIAEELALSVKTVSTYRARLLEKMQLRTNAELTRYAFERGLVA
jgi:DNA-binding NarL/FixJ family response regulator